MPSDMIIDVGGYMSTLTQSTDNLSPGTISLPKKGLHHAIPQYQSCSGLSARGGVNESCPKDAGRFEKS